MSTMLTLAEVAARIRRSRYTTRKLARIGRLPGAKKIGRDWLFQPGKIDEFVNGKERK